MTDEGRPQLEALEGGRQAQDQEPSHFGSCPKCGGGGAYRNIGRVHFFYCDAHRLTWCAGENLMSSWRDESPADWRAAWEHIKGYRTVDGFGQADPGLPLERQTTVEALMPAWASADAPEIDLDVDFGELERPGPTFEEFGGKPRPGELRELANLLDGARQMVADALSTSHPLYRLIDGALRSGDLEDLRTAKAAISGLRVHF